MFFDCNFCSIFLDLCFFICVNRNNCSFLRFIVVAAAFFRISKNFRTFVTDSCFFRNRLESSGYYEIVICFLLVDIWISVIDILLLMLEVITSSCITCTGRESAHSYLKPLERFICEDINPLLVIMELLYVYSILMKFFHCFKKKSSFYFMERFFLINL